MTPFSVFQGIISKYMHIYEDDLVSMGIFLVPKGGRLPLHNHPDMKVASRLLFGTLQVQSYSWEDSEELTATLAHEGVVTAPALLTLEEERGNLHDLVAISEEGAAFFDVLCPPYSPSTGRDCSYYEIAQDWEGEDGVVSGDLTQIEQPNELVINHSPYEGDQVWST